MLKVKLLLFGCTLAQSFINILFVQFFTDVYSNPRLQLISVYLFPVFFVLT